MDPFAQSRADDDLFADEFEPVPEPTPIVEPTPSAPNNDVKPVEIVERLLPETNGRGGRPKQQNQRGSRGPRGGGRGGQNGIGASKFANPTTTKGAEPASASAPVPAPVNSQEPAEPQVKSTSPDPLPAEPSQTPQIVAPTEPSANRTLAVRGDRSATGGPAHKKLTEDELTAKLEKMAIINAQKAERHRLTEADQAAYQHREAELQKERKQKAVAERKNERLMEMERAKNRERKMKAQGGREWDSEKTEADIVDRKGRSSEFVRGGFGGVIRGGGLAGSKYAAQDVNEDGENSNRSSGRGGFEPRGRGRGRGGRGGGRGGSKVLEKTVPTAEDFPPLSSAPVTSPPPGGDWAEEMATPVEEKKLELKTEKS